jgi:hypothetical protein
MAVKKTMSQVAKATKVPAVKTLKKSPVSPTYRQLDGIKMVATALAADRKKEQITRTVPPNLPGQGDLGLSRKPRRAFSNFREVPMGEQYERATKKLKSKKSRHPSETY